MSSQDIMSEVFRGFDETNEHHIFIVVILRKILNDLYNLRTHYNHIPNIISYVNAVASNNINMIDEETRQFEETYLRENVIFPVHPLELIQKIVNKGTPDIIKLRTLLYKIYENQLGDTGSINTLNTWLLTVDIPTYHSVTKQIYT